MARVSQPDVEEIFDNSLSLTLTAFITAANLVVTDALSGSGLSEAHLKEIERWLAAHLVAIRDPREFSKKTGDASAVFFKSSGLGLDTTPYGQQVKVLDTTNRLALLGKPRAKFAVIGSSKELP